MNKPRIEPMGMGWRLTWEEEEIVIEVPRIRKGQRDDIKAELLITSKRKDTLSKLTHEDLNLRAGRSKNALAKHLGEVLPEINWLEIINVCADKLLEIYQTGEPAMTLHSWDETIGPTPMLLNPLVPLYMPTVFFGDGGTSKSLLVQALGIIAYLPWKDNPLGLQVDGRHRKLLYLDWESDWREIARRLKCFSNGMGLEALEMEYRRCSLPLKDDLEFIQNLLLTTETEVVIIDSLGPASGGDVERRDTALDFYNATRSLKTSKGEPPTILIVAHEPKNALKKSIIGSVYFGNLARAVYQIKAQSRGTNIIEQSIHCSKTNPIGTQEPLGIKFTWGAPHEMKLTFEKDETIDTLKEKVSILMQVMEILRDGPRSFDVLSRAIGTSVSKKTLTVVLSRGKRSKQLVLLPEGLWALGARGRQDEGDQ